MDYKAQAEAHFHSASFDKSLLPDISGVSISGPDAQARMESFLNAVGNPYLFRVGDIGVHVVFSGTAGDSLQQRICRLLSKSV